MIKQKLIAFNINESVRDNLPTLESLVRRAKELGVEDLRIAGIPFTKRAIQEQIDAGKTRELIKAHVPTLNPLHLIERHSESRRAILSALHGLPNFPYGTYSIDFGEGFWCFVRGVTVSRALLNEGAATNKEEVQVDLQLDFKFDGIGIAFYTQNTRRGSGKAPGDSHYALGPFTFAPTSTSVGLMWKASETGTELSDLKVYEYTLADFDLQQVMRAVAQRVNEAITRIVGNA
ncbi:MAG: hypothetical protein HQ596_01905 [Candidatus Saganbacteria bacterium]|nr:hypothetical protein [Candidatus Saganbacteria bacterium]